MKKILLPVVALSLMLSQQAYAQGDDADQKARTEMASELLRVSPPSTLVDQVMEGLTKNPRMKFTDEEVKGLKAGVDYAVLEKAMKDSLVKTFTVEELKTMIQIYGSPAGKSITQKMPTYMAEIMPVLTQQVQVKVGDMMKKKMAEQQGAVAPGMTPAPPAAESAPTPAATAAPAEAAPAAPAEAKPAEAPAAATPTPAPAK